jgi:hypothetical protein
MPLTTQLRTRIGGLRGAGLTPADTATLEGLVADAETAQAAAEAAADGAASMNATIIDVLSTETTVGNTPGSSGSGFNKGTFVYPTTQVRPAYVKQFSLYAGATGSVILKRMSGDDDGPFALEEELATLTIGSTGSNTFTTADFGVIELAAGEYLGFSTSTDNVIRYNGGTGGSFYYDASATATSVSSARTEVLQVLISLDVVTDNVPGQILDQEVDLLSAFGITEYIGTTAALVLGSSYSAATTVLATPVSGDRVLKSITLHAGATGIASFGIYSRSGDDFTRESIIGSFTIGSTGEHTLDLEDFGRVAIPDGYYLGFWTATNGLFRYNGTAANQRYSTSTVGAAAFTDSTVAQEVVQVTFETVGYPAGGFWSGKTGVAFGDSITWQDGQAYGTGRDDEGEIAVGWPSYVRASLGCSVNNQAASGRSMTELWTEKISPFDFTNYDFVWFTAGTNDYREDVAGDEPGSIAAIGATFNASTFTGALQAAVEKALDDNPDILIFLGTPIRGWFFEEATSDVPNPNAEDTVLPETFADRVKEVAELYGLPVVDWYNQAGPNELNRLTYLGDADGLSGHYLLHPRDNFYRIMGSLAVAKMKEYGQ